MRKMSKLDKQHPMINDFWEILDNYKDLPLPKYPIYIPSKGRAETKATAANFEENNIPYTFSIEKEDEEKYRKAFPNAEFIILEKSNQGNPYSRNTIKEHALKNGHKYHWHIDDDIKKMAYYLDGKNNYFDNFAQCLSIIEAVCDKYENIGAASPRSSAFSRTEKSIIGFNKNIYCVMLLKNDNDIWFRPDVLEDKDMSMQILANGECTVLFNRLLMFNPSTGTNSGGHGVHSERVKSRAERAKQLAKNWPGAFELRETKDGLRPKPSRIWQTFKQRPIKKGENNMNIHETLKDLLIDIDDVKPFSKNPRKGNVDKIQQSLQANGQYRPIVVNKKTNEILAGNHTWQAAKILGWKKIAATFVDVSKEEAKKIVLIDNKSSDDADYYNETLKELLEDLKNDLDGTGYSESDLNTLIADTMPKTDAFEEWENMPDFESEDVSSAYKTTVHFPTEEDADNFFKLLGVERKKVLWYPDTDGHKPTDGKKEYIKEEE